MSEQRLPFNIKFKAIDRSHLMCSFRNTDDGETMSVVLMLPEARRIIDAAIEAVVNGEQKAGAS